MLCAPSTNHRHLPGAARRIRRAARHYRRGAALRQLAVANPVRLIGLDAQAPLAIRFVIGVVAFKPHDLRIALEGQNVGGDAIQKPAIMGNDHRATGEGEQRFFQRPQRLHIQIVGRLVQQQHIAAAPEQLGEMHPVPFAAG